jgi:hypothetical protein
VNSRAGFQIDWSIYQNNSLKYLNRYGHLAFPIENGKIMIFGGEIGKETGQGMRGVTNDILIVDIESENVDRH